LAQSHQNTYLDFDLVKKITFYSLDTIFFYKIIDGKYEKLHSSAVTVGIETFNRKIKFYTRPVAYLTEKPDLELEVFVEEVSKDYGGHASYVKTAMFSADKTIKKWYVHYLLYGNNKLEYLKFTDTPTILDCNESFWYVTEEGKNWIEHAAIPKK
jgi:hypothetical protein